MRHRAPALITLLTDFGQADSYVAQMQGVILNMLPDARIAHLGHDIPPQDIVQAGFFLLSCYSFYPPGTIHVVVVDPGVGTPRKILAIETRRYKFLVPDNGLIAPVLEKAGPLRIIELNQGRYCRKPTSRTFHGRDCFAPAAARLAAGLNIRKLGQSISPLRIHPGKLWPPAKILKGRLEGIVITRDRFGNLITNIRRKDLPDPKDALPGMQIVAGGRRIGPLVLTYAAGPPGRLVAIFASSGLLEIAVNRGSALKKLTGKDEWPRKAIHVNVTMEKE